MVERVAIPESAANLSLMKHDAINKSTVVPIAGSGAEVYTKSSRRLVVRRQRRGGPKVTNSRAAALQGCRGKRGEEFARCLDNALGVVPCKIYKEYGIGTPGSSECLVGKGVGRRRMVTARREVGLI